MATTAAKTAKTATAKTKSKAPAAPKAAKPEKTKGEGKSKKGADGAAPAEAPKRKLGLRGAAPWAARHAAKHAAEARARAAEPPPPGSARATIRTPTGVEQIKAQIVELHNQLEQLKSQKKNVAKNFFEIGTILRDIQTRKLYGAKGFQSFEAFLEREVDLSKAVALRLAKMVTIFQRAAAVEYGVDKVLEATAVLDNGGETAPKPGSQPPAPPPSRSVSSMSKGPIVGRLVRSREAPKPRAKPFAPGF